MEQLALQKLGILISENSLTPPQVGVALDAACGLSHLHYASPKVGHSALKRYDMNVRHIV